MPGSAEAVVHNFLNHFDARIGVKLSLFNQPEKVLTGLAPPALDAKRVTDDCGIQKDRRLNHGRSLRYSRSNDSFSSSQSMGGPVSSALASRRSSASLRDFLLRESRSSTGVKQASGVFRRP